MSENESVKWIVSCAWIETRPNNNLGYVHTKNGVKVPWAQTERPINHHFGQVASFDSESDAHKFVTGCRHVNPGWLPPGAHSFEVSDPLRVARPKG